MSDSQIRTHGVIHPIISKLSGKKEVKCNESESKYIDSALSEPWGQTLAESSNVTRISIAQENAIQLISSLCKAVKMNSKIVDVQCSGTVGEEGIVLFADTLAARNGLTTVSLSKSSMGGAGATLLARALTLNKTITTFELVLNNIGDDGARALAEALKVNCTLTSIVLHLENNIDDTGAAALAEALRTNTRLNALDLSSNRIGADGAAALATALTANSTLTTLLLSTNPIGDEGAMALAPALRKNKSLTRLSVCQCGIEDLGLLYLCDAMTDNQTLKVLSAWDNSFSLRATAEALSILSHRMQHDTPSRPLHDHSTSVLLKSWLAANARKMGLSHFATEYWPQCKIPALHQYGAMAAALANDPASTLDRMRLCPDNLKQVVCELQEGSFVPWRAAGVMREHLALPDKAATTAARAASAVASVVQGSGTLSVVNVHICGDGYAGKTTTREALVRCLPAGSSPLRPGKISVRWEEGRTLGMVTTAVDYSGENRMSLRALLHDYGGQEEFRANHATDLAAPNSVYVLVLPLWDKRPRPKPHDKKPVDAPMNLDDLVAMYTNWLKFINSVVAEKCARCITVLNFVEEFEAQTRSYTVQDAVAALKAVQDSFRAIKASNIIFIAEPLPVNASLPVSVKDILAPVLKAAINALAAAPVPVAPALQTVLADMATRNKWPLFSYENDLRKLIYKAVAAKHTPSGSEFPEKSVRDGIVQAIAQMMQGLLESRRDVVVLRVLNGDRVAINFPNWLTEKLLGSLFDPRRRAHVNEAAAVSAAGNPSDPTHLLSAADINKAVNSNLDESTRNMIDAQFIPRLLQHVGVCIPVVLDEDGFARGVAENDDETQVTHWFPAFNTARMKDTDGVPLKNADHMLARLFRLSNPAICVFPPGYFPSLFVSIVALYNKTNLVQLFHDGMELCSGDDSFQIVVRRSTDENSYVVTVATAGTPAGSLLAFDTMEAIRELIFGPGSWRSNVHVEEFGLHPTKKAAPIAIASLEQRLLNPDLRGENVAFYFGLERKGPDHMVPLQLQAVLTRLDVLDSKTDACVDAVVSRLDRLSAQVIAHFEATERVQDILSWASAEVVSNRAQMRTVCERLKQALPARDIIDALEGQCQKARDLIQQQQEKLDSEASFNATKLQQMKTEIVEELTKVAEDMQRSTLATLSEREAVQSAVAEERMQRMLGGNFGSTGDALRILQKELKADISKLKSHKRRLRVDSARQHSLDEKITRLQESITAVQAVQKNDVYGVYELPLLAEIKSPKPKGTVKDSALRCFFDVHVLHFLCPACGAVAASGPKQKGYKLLVPKGWVTTVSKVLEVSLQVLQVVSLVTPLPLPRIAELAQYLPTDELQAIVNALDFGKAQVVSLVNADSELQDRNAAGTPGRRVPPEITLAHVSGIRELLQKAGESIPPKDTGLSPAICAVTQQCAWVCAKCRDKYMAQGDTCLAIRMKLT